MDFARSFVVNTAQMQRIEELMFAQGMPVEALMEKVGLALSERIRACYPEPDFERVGVLVGPGHNGGDALVVARELLMGGRQVEVYCPVPPAKPLTCAHLSYFEHLGGIVRSGQDTPAEVDLWIDGLFGFGLNRPVTGPAADAIERLNSSGKPVVAIDLPSGLATDTGAVLGTAVRAVRTLCLGLWKCSVWQDAALEYVGEVERIDFGISLKQWQAAIGEETLPRLILPEYARACLPLLRPPATHKYKVGSTLVVSGSRRYLGAPHLSALGARASGTGMLNLATIATVRDLLSPVLPEVIFFACPEDDAGTIRELPIDLSRYDAVVCGPGLGPVALEVLEEVVRGTEGGLVLDADALSIVEARPDLLKRRGPTILTPHTGEFRRIFPNIDPVDRLEAARDAARHSGCWVVLKGAKTVVGTPEGEVWINPDSSAALARGGSGDVLAGLIGGLFAQTRDPRTATLGGVWWHARTAHWLAHRRTVLGVDPQTLAEGLIPFLSAE
ncbi:MAG: NAD(P)H-hydrate dehydratase [Gemmatimonadaceae bacterium]|nr:NAD(P)H-hydrate dehydratase [Gloeobacterales cyanobacterium ES-bin-141]